MDFSFFTIDNKSGYKTNEKWLSKNYLETYQSILDFTSDCTNDLNFKEKIYFYFHNLKERPKCLKCGDYVKFRNRFDKPYGDFCTLDCANSSKEELVKRQKETFNVKYGVDFFPQHNEFIKKQKQTKLTKYGNENYNNIGKQKQTKLTKYGNENYNNIGKQKTTCELKYGVDNYSKSNNYRNKITNEYINLYPDVNFVEIKKGSVIIRCNECDNNCEITKQLLYERNKRNYNPCINCNPLGFNNRSGYEAEICNFLDEHNVQHLTNYKINNTKLEIDILLSDLNIGIEFNGLYWHNELFKPQNYHIDKTFICNKLGIDLIHIFEDEWIYKKDIVKSILLNKLNKIDTKIYGRKCEIREVSSKDSKTFLDENHIQGNVNSKVRLGLYFNNELVSLMTFSRGRVIMGGKKNEWELNRFCNKLNTNVIGSASKLLKYFINVYKPIKLVSYSDIRLFSGKLYEKLNFKLVSQSKPNYWYIIGDKRHYRFNFKKSNLVRDGYNPNKTEKQIMFDRKIYRIYDCGNLRWELTID
jgi:hypothetical protein